MLEFGSPLYSVIKTLQKLFGMVLFYLVVMELSLLICGFSFNFRIFSFEQQNCRKMLRQCSDEYAYFGKLAAACSPDCLENPIISLKGVSEHNPITNAIDNYIAGRPLGSIMPTPANVNKARQK